MSPRRLAQITFSELARRVLAMSMATHATHERVRYMLAHAEQAFGPRRLATITPWELTTWAATFDQPLRWEVVRVVKHALAQAVRMGWLEQDPAAAIRNRAPDAPEARPFASWPEVDRVRLPWPIVHLPRFAVGTGLRPGELLALRWGDVDIHGCRVHVTRGGGADGALKTRASRRSVPLRWTVVQTLFGAMHRLEQMPGGIDGMLRAYRNDPVFPHPTRGGPIDVRLLRRRWWHPALEAAGLERRRLYDLRHTYATWSLRAGVSTFQLARRMGTSVTMIERTYGHLAADADEHERDLLDAWDAGSA